MNKSLITLIKSIFRISYSIKSQNNSIEKSLIIRIRQENSLKKDKMVLQADREQPCNNNSEGLCNKKRNISRWFKNKKRK